MRAPPITDVKLYARSVCPLYVKVCHVNTKKYFPSQNKKNYGQEDLLFF